jgi:outer membrane protein OmpA-like peptidoglycan-associated protein
MYCFQSYFCVSLIKKVFNITMKKDIKLIVAAMCLLAVSCSTYKNMNKSQQGAVIGGGGGAAVGAIVGKISGNTALGALIGAAVGGTAGAVIGHEMDKQAAEIQNDIPTAKVQRVAEGIEVEFSSKVLFGFDSYKLTDSSKSSLNQLIMVMNKYAETNIEVQGHTDSLGSAEYNQKLSEERAQSVAAYLLANNIASSRVTTKGYGMLYPKYSNSTADGRAQNRRVEFLISANDKMKTDAQKEAGN